MKKQDFIRLVKTLKEEDRWTVKTHSDANPYSVHKTSHYEIGLQSKDGVYIPLIKQGRYSGQFIEEFLISLKTKYNKWAKEGLKAKIK